MNNHHFLVVCFPIQSHIIPTLRLATKLTAVGAQVTFTTTVNGLKNLKTRSSIPALSYDSFSDGHDESSAHGITQGYFQEAKIASIFNFRNLLLTKAKEGRKVDFIIYSMCMPWVAKVAGELHVPSAFFFLQSASSFSMMYHYIMKNDGEVLNSNIEPTAGTMKIPGLPVLTYQDIPAYLQPEHTLAPIFQEHIDTLEKHPNPLVLINTFEGLEEESIIGIPNRFKIFSIGPLYSNEAEDLSKESYIKWLDSKPEKSVIYIAFGSVVNLHKKQKEEMLQGLIESGRPFLWAIRDNGDEMMKNYTQEYDGMLVKWCSQVEVLSHVAIGCFVTHCGWNSVMESVVSGVGMVGCPQFSDQMINARMVEQVWGNGVKAMADGDGVVGKEEIKRCLEVVMGGGKIKIKCEKLKCMAMQAVAEGGSSHTKLKQCIENLKCTN